MELGEKLIGIAKVRIDVPGMVDDILDQVLEETLKEVVAKSETPIDDAIVALVYPPLESLLKAKVREAWLKIL